jgi:ADP-ribosylglycohydrolase
METAIIATKTIKSTPFQKAMGCIVGAFCGDAIGAPVEFSTAPINPKKMESVMKMTSGVHSLVPGQITDDSEMALCLLHALLEVVFWVSASVRKESLM